MEIIKFYPCRRYFQNNVSQPFSDCVYVEYDPETKSAWKIVGQGYGGYHDDALRREPSENVTRLCNKHKDNRMEHWTEVFPWKQ